MSHTHTQKLRISRHLWCNLIYPSATNNNTKKQQQQQQHLQHCQSMRVCKVSNIIKQKNIRLSESYHAKLKSCHVFIDFLQLATCELKDGSKVSSLYSARPLNFVTQPLLLNTLWTCPFTWSSQINRQNWIIKESLKVKPPTIWRDEKQRWEESDRREEQKRERERVRT